MQVVCQNLMANVRFVPVFAWLMFKLDNHLRLVGDAEQSVQITKSAKGTAERITMESDIGFAEDALFGASLLP